MSIESLGGHPDAPGRTGSGALGRHWGAAAHQLEPCEPPEVGHLDSPAGMTDVEEKLALWQTSLIALARAHREVEGAKTRAADSLDVLHLQVEADVLTRQSDTAYVALLRALLAARSGAQRA